LRYCLLLLALLLPFAPTARADVENLTLLDQVQLEGVHLPSLSEPILGDNGAAYWHARIDYSLGGSLLKNESGILLSDARTGVEAGDWPLQDRPTDARGPVVLLSGTYFEPADGGGYAGTGAIYMYPGLTRLVYWNSIFPGFTNHPIQLQVTSRGFLDIDNSVVFLMRRATTFPNFNYTICRETGGAIAILAQTGVTTVPDGDGGTFTLFQRPTVDGGVILFYGEGGGRRGVYQMVGGVVTKVVDNQTTLPGNASPAFILGQGDVAFANDGLDVALVLRELSGGGVWKRIDGQWTRIVAINTPIPNGVGNFFDLNLPAIRDEKVVFLGGRDNQFVPPLQNGIYTDAFGGVTRVVDLSTPFLHEMPHDFVVADGGRWFDGTDISFAVQGTAFVEDWRALYRATPVPESGTAAAGALALAMLLAIRQSRI
jgi:hypothetical protein